MAELSGELSLLAGHELLGLLGARAVTGQLELLRGGIQRRIAILDGSAIAAASSDPREHIGALLVRSGHVTYDAAEQAYRTQLETSLPIGRILTMTGLVSEAVVRFTIHAKIRETVLDVATWSEGRFEFSRQLEVPEATGLEVALPLQELVEVARPRIERMRALSLIFPSGGTKVVTVAGARGLPGTHEALLLEATRRPQTLDDLGVLMHEAPLRILEQAAALVAQGLLRIDDTVATRRTSPRTATPPEEIAPLAPAPMIAPLAPASLSAPLAPAPLSAPLPPAPASAPPAFDLGEELFAEPVEPSSSSDGLAADLFAEPVSTELDDLAAELAGPTAAARPAPDSLAVDLAAEFPSFDDPPPPAVPDEALFGALADGNSEPEPSHDLVVDDDEGGLDAAAGAVLDDERADAAASDELALDTLPEDVEEEPWFPVDEAPMEDVRTASQLAAAARQALGRGAHEEALELAQRAVAREHGEETTGALRAVEAELLLVLRAELYGKGFFPLLKLERADVRAMSLSPPERFFLARMDGQRELATLVKLVPLREVDALRLVRRARAAGHVAAAAPPPAPPLATLPAPEG